MQRHFSYSGLSGCCRYLLCIFIQVLIVLSLFHWCLIMGNGICALSLYCVCVTWYAFHINYLNISEINQLWSRFMEAGRRNHHWFHLSASIDSFTLLALIWINFASSGKKKKRCPVWKNSKGRSSGWDGILILCWVCYGGWLNNWFMFSFFILLNLLDYNHNWHLGIVKFTCIQFNYWFFSTSSTSGKKLLNSFVRR